MVRQILTKFGLEVVTVGLLIIAMNITDNILRGVFQQDVSVRLSLKFGAAVAAAGVLAAV